MICLPFPFIHLLAFPKGSAPYALLPSVITALSFHRTILISPKLLKSYDPRSFFFNVFHVRQRAFHDAVLSQSASCTETHLIQIHQELVAREKISK